jgi:hypothetical protein
LRAVVSGKYKRGRKEVVSDLAKVWIGSMGFLNRAGKCRLPRSGAKCLVFLDTTDCYLRNPYKSLRTSSTLSGYLVLRFRDQPSSVESGELRKAAELMPGWVAL